MVEKWETLEKSIFYISCFIIVSGFWNEISKGLNKNKYKELTSTNLTRYSQNRLQFLTKIGACLHVKTGAPKTPPPPLSFDKNQK